MRGDFVKYNSVNNSNRIRVARLSPDGVLDTGFTPGAGADAVVRTTAMQSDGKIIIGGSFTSYDGIGRNSIARLNADGSLDIGFNPGTGANNPCIPSPSSRMGRSSSGVISPITTARDVTAWHA
ncbi:MAG: delta-60 repeat domain-containing protein [Flavobacteriales bacterium]|nr:delta-60 repeat domain-containing protein [Flavobacteriales bacterium]